MNKKYFYLFRDMYTGKTTVYFFPMNMEPVGILYAIKSLSRIQTGLKKFQVGVCEYTVNAKNTVWYPAIYTVCENICDDKYINPNEIALNNNFIPIKNPGFLPAIISQNYIQTGR